MVTCVELTSDGKYLITGSKDTTIMVWKISSNHKVDEIPVHILWGHDEEIISVQSNVELDVVVSTSKGTSIIVHTLRSGKYVRSIFHPQGLPFDLINISSVGTLVSFCVNFLNLLFHFLLPLFFRMLIQPLELIVLTENYYVLM